jgi:hypothetical protein
MCKLSSDRTGLPQVKHGLSQCSRKIIPQSWITGYQDNPLQVTFALTNGDLTNKGGLTNIWVGPGVASGQNTLTFTELSITNTEPQTRDLALEFGKKRAVSFAVSAVILH